MRRVLFFSLLSVLILPHYVFASTGPDLGFNNKSDITFSTKELIAGKTIRVYARVHNFGDVDVAGYVSFMEGSIAVGDTQVISVRANGVDEEVYVDFVVPEGPFNINAIIKGTDPADTNTANDSVLSTLFTPVHDDDADGVANEIDNCLTVSNSDQLDTDGDKIGDACDPDSDNDTLSNTVEAELGTNPLKADSDGDGVTDPNDYAPNDASVSIAPPPAPVVVPAPEVIAAPTVEAVGVTTPPTSASNAGSTNTATTSTVPGSAATTVTTDTTLSNNNGATQNDLQISPNAIFSYEQTNWNSYHFSIRGFQGVGYRYAWDFGDGVTSSRSDIDHTYRSFGDYKVTLTITDDHGQQATDSTNVSISFFHFENPYLKMLLGGLVVLFFLSIGFLVRSMKRSKKSRMDDSEESL